ncbi:MAG: hypothetical protein WB660_03400 [Candidatus Sulfotelmatobacter sp.]
MATRICVLLLCLPLCLPIFGQNFGSFNQETPEQVAKGLRTLVEAAPKLAFSAPTELVVQPPKAGWEMGMVSWIALDGNGNLYLLQRGAKADPILVVDRQGHLLHSWGNGRYKIPHSIRIDQQGNVWTVDASSSVVLKYSPQGEKLMDFDVGGQLKNSGNAFNGATDIAFGPNGRLFIADG